MVPIIERAVRLETKLLVLASELQNQPTRVFKPAPFRPGRRVADLEARLLAASNALTDTSKLEHLP
jgi:hypothetical protein